MELEIGNIIMFHQSIATVFGTHNVFQVVGIKNRLVALRLMNKDNLNLKIQMSKATIAQYEYTLYSSWDESPYKERYPNVIA